MLRRTEIKISEDEILLEITTWDSTEIYHELRIDTETIDTEMIYTGMIDIGMIVTQRNVTGVSDTWMKDIEMTATEKKSTETLVIGMNDTGTND